jgi:hypothetical protein
MPNYVSPLIYYPNSILMICINHTKSCVRIILNVSYLKEFLGPNIFPSIVIYIGEHI